MVRSLKESGKTTFKLLLSHFNFNFENLANNFDIGFQNYFRQLFEIYERSFPLIKKTDKTKRPAPWMTLKLKECIRKNLFRKTAQYFLDTTYQRSRYNSIMVRDIEKYYIT